MNVELSGKTEKTGTYLFFGKGRFISLMSRLVNEGYNSAGIGTIIDKRMNAPEDVVEAWQLNYFCTGDSAGTDETGCVVLTLDSPGLRKLYLGDSASLSYTHALHLSSEQWNEMKRDENSLHLTSEEVDKVQGKGYIKKNGVWQPANSEVGKVWDFLTQGKDLKKYAQMVSKKFKDKEMMRLYFDRTKPIIPNLRPLAINDYYDSNVYGNTDLKCNNHCLAGVASEALQPANEQSEVCSHVGARENGGHYRNAGRSSEEVLEERLAEKKEEEGKVKGYILGTGGEILDEWFEVEENADRIDFSDLELKLSLPFFIPKKPMYNIPKYGGGPYCAWEITEAVSDVKRIAEDNGLDVCILALGEEVITGFDVKRDTFMYNYVEGSYSKIGDLYGFACEETYSPPNISRENALTEIKPISSLQAIASFYCRKRVKRAKKRRSKKV